MACADEVERVFETQTSGNVAAMIAEPVMGEGGIIVPPPEYFPKVKPILERNEALSFRMRYRRALGVPARCLPARKSVSSRTSSRSLKALPTAFRSAPSPRGRKSANRFCPAITSAHSAGNLVSAAAAIATIGFLEREQVPAHARRLGRYILNELETWRNAHPLIGDVRGKGLMIGIELVTDQETKIPAADEAKRVQEECRKAGLLIGCGGFYGNVLRFQPPLIITLAQADQALEILEKALATSLDEVVLV